MKVKQLVRRRSVINHFSFIWGTSLMVERSKSSLVLRLCQQLSNACRSLMKRFDSSVPHHFDKETCHGKISFFEAGKIKKKVIVVRYI